MKVFQVLLGLAFALAAVLGVLHYEHAAHQSAAIAKVFTQQSQAAKSSLQGVDSFAEKKHGLMLYAQGLQAIDASDCPKDFQAAWFDFVKAVTLETQKNLSLAEVKDKEALAAWLEAHHYSLADLRSGAVANDSDDILPSFQRCQKIATGYGLSFHRNP
jgi:hypothetical protein